MSKIDKTLIGIRIRGTRALEHLRSKRVSGESHLIAIVSAIGIVLFIAAAFKEQLSSVMCDTVYPSMESEVANMFTGASSGGGTVTQ